MLGLLKLIPASVWKGLSGALVASVVALAGLWYMNTLNEDIERLQSDLERSRQEVAVLEEFKENYMQNRVVYTEIENNIHKATKVLHGSYNDMRSDIDEIAKTKSAKGINRVIPAVIVDRMCSDAGKEYCYRSYNEDRSTSEP